MGKRIGLIGENSVEYVNALIDIWNAGNCAVLIDWRVPFQAAENMMKEAAVEACYIEKSILEKNSFENCEIKYISFNRKSNSAELIPNEILNKFNENFTKDEAIVLYSSGTTGKAKGIILSHFAINTNADAIIEYMQPADKDCIYIAKTLSHSSTLTGELLVGLKTRVKIVIAPTIVPPRFTLKNIEKFHATILCLNPTLLSLYADEQKRSNHNLNSLRTIYVSGSILNDKIYETAKKTFKVTNIFNVYGLSEAGPRVSAQTKECFKANSVGKAIEGVEIVVVDDNGKELRQGDKGIIHVKTPSVFDEYVKGNKELDSLYKGWLNTGDVGFFDENGELHIVSRVDDVIIIDSHKIYPSEVEEHIIANTSISECVVVKLEINGNEFIGCLYANQCEIDKDIKDQLKSALLPYEIPRYFLRCDAIPRSTNGKILMKEAKEYLLKELKHGN